MKRTTETHSWRVVYTSDEFNAVHDDLRIIDTNGADHPQGPFTVARVNNTHHRHHGIDAARLMAAAPEMLEALRAAQCELETPTGARNMLTLQVSQAIAAATTRPVHDARMP